MAERDLDALLADPRHRPAGGWSARAEAFADASWGGWRHTYDLWREEQRLQRAEADAELLYVALEAERAWKGNRSLGAPSSVG